MPTFRPRILRSVPVTIRPAAPTNTDAVVLPMLRRLHATLSLGCAPAPAPGTRALGPLPLPRRYLHPPQRNLLPRLAHDQVARRPRPRPGAGPVGAPEGRPRRRRGQPALARGRAGGVRRARLRRSRPRGHQAGRTPHVDRRPAHDAGGAGGVRAALRAALRGVPRLPVAVARNRHRPRPARGRKPPDPPRRVDLRRRRQLHRRRRHPPRRYRDVGVRVPFALAAVVFALLPLSWLPLWLRRRSVRRRRLVAGQCPRCAYDQRGSPDQCPECGRISIARETDAARRGFVPLLLDDLRRARPRRARSSPRRDGRGAGARRRSCSSGTAPPPARRGWAKSPSSAASWTSSSTGSHGKSSACGRRAMPTAPPGWTRS